MATITYVSKAKVTLWYHPTPKDAGEKERKALTPWAPALGHAENHLGTPVAKGKPHPGSRAQGHWLSL